MSHRRLPHICLAPLLTIALRPASVLAHGGEPHGPSPSWWTAWNPDPFIMTSLGAISLLFGIGAIRAWRHGGGVGTAGVPVVRAGAFAAGIACLIVALLSPIDALADELGWVHMVQHMLIMMVAAPLFVLGAPLRASLWALPARWRPAPTRWMRRAGAWRPARYVLWQPVLTWSLFAAVLWVWHVPVLYESALRVRIVHEVQHLMFFAASCLFWRVLLDPIAHRRLSRGAGIIYLFTHSLQATVLGVFMALAPRAWYADYIGRTDAFGMSALEDQQIAGLTMWMPACLIYALIAAVVLALWIRESEQPPRHPRPDPHPSGGLS